jgi:hypothetical protein
MLFPHWVKMDSGISKHEKNQVSPKIPNQRAMYLIQGFGVIDCG